MKCESCGLEVSERGRTCPACGAERSHVTRTVASTPAATAATPSSRSSSGGGISATRARLSLSTASDGRFPPGAIIADRYRIVALLGRGGMGEVYRADDLTLGQTVALKFLPDSATENESALARFYNEVRIARQVSHPNVCRVYDLGEADGKAYLSMEYVDGEDLSSLLRRIGRLPGDKALEIARKLCAGLAAAHDRGVLHRDLKPSNIMLDSHGQVLITDFGLAGVADQMHGVEVRNGTPAYMAPEQLAGTGVSTASDIYSLGLVLYEVFTGKRAFEASSVPELLRLQTQGKPPSMTSTVRDLDPAIERVILRCLDPDPRNRPSSALAVAAALPGGDPLAAALAAGETPSPQMVAAAGETTTMRPRAAIASLVVVLAGIVVVAALNGWTSLLSRVPSDMPRDALRIKAREVLASSVYTAKPYDFAQGFTWNEPFLRYARTNDKPRADWSRIGAGRPAPLEYWYRQAQADLTPAVLFNGATSVSGVTPDDPPLDRPGMSLVRLDAQGNLVYLLSVPPQFEDKPGSAVPPDWTPLFRAAGIDPSLLSQTTPQWHPLISSDARAAWTGTWPGPEKRPLRIEAAAFRGKPVYFHLIGPWTEPRREVSKGLSAGDAVSVGLMLTLLVSAFAFGLFLAWRHYSQGRSDIRGALRLGAFLFAVVMTMWLTGGHHRPSLWMIPSFALAAGHALLYASAVWVLYMALEPMVRKRWPQTIISWSRMLAGRIRDPLVGRDILLGLVLGVIMCMVLEVRMWLILQQGGAPETPFRDWFAGPGTAIATWLRWIPNSIQGVLMLFFLIFGLRALLRREWLAAIAFVLVFSVPALFGSEHRAIDLPVNIVLYTLCGFFLIRFGLVTLATGMFLTNVLMNAPITFNASAWYFNVGLAVVMSMLAITVFAFHSALAGKALVKDEWFE